MGLDWIVETKPNNHNIDNINEYYKLKYKLHVLNKCEKNHTEEIEHMIKELEEEKKCISITPKETLESLVNDDDYFDDFLIGGSFMTSNFDFRGEYVGQSDILAESLKEEAYDNHNAEQCIEYACKLEVYLESITELDEEEQEDYDCILKAIKWLKFWGSNGHGYYAWY